MFHRPPRHIRGLHLANTVTCDRYLRMKLHILRLEGPTVLLSLHRQIRILVHDLQAASAGSPLKGMKFIGIYSIILVIVFKFTDLCILKL